MKYYSTFIFCILTITNVYSKAQLSLKTATNIFEIHLDNRSHGQTSIRKIVVKNLKGKRLQTIKPDYGINFKSGYASLQEYDFYFEDINNDEIDDIIFLKNHDDLYLYEYNYCYLSNKSNNLFEKLIGFDTIPNINFSLLPIITSNLYSFYKFVNLRNMCFHINGNKVVYDSSSNISYHSFKLNRECDNMDTTFLDLDFSQYQSKGFCSKEYFHNNYNYIFYYDSTKKDDYSDIFMVVKSKSGDKILTTNLKYKNITFPKWCFTKDSFINNYIKEIDINNDNKFDIVMEGGNWPSGIAVWLFNLKGNNMNYVNEFDNPVAIKTNNDTVEYFVYEPCGTGFPTRTKHKFIVRGLDFQFIGQTQINTVRLEKGDLIEIHKEIEAKDGLPILVSTKVVRIEN